MEALEWLHRGVATFLLQLQLTARLVAHVAVA